MLSYQRPILADVTVVADVVDDADVTDVADDADDADDVDVPDDAADAQLQLLMRVDLT